MGIKVEQQKESENGWEFEVLIDGIKYEVDVGRDYWSKLAPDTEPEELVRKSFEFLLARESKEAILRKFNLRAISTYFPEYETTFRYS